ncbi:MAG: FAD-dependent oxidoreductase [Candidatus Pacearchaeota archaeon]
MEKTEVAIIGGGPGGLAAAIYCRRYELDVIIFDIYLGGTIMKTDIIENYPGFKEINGFELAKRIEEHALSYSPKVVSYLVDKIEKRGKSFILTAGGKEYEAKAVILATGTKWKKLGVKGEDEFSGKGVNYCAICDAQLYKGKKVVFVGAGNSAAKDALMLSDIVEKVYIISRKTFHPEPINLAKVKKKKNIELIENTQIKEIIGDRKVSSVKLDKPYKGKDFIEVSGVFVDIGREPITQLAKILGVKLNDKSEVITDSLMRTNIAGFFAIGDIREIPIKQAIIATGDGAIAAYSAHDYIKNAEVSTYG